MHTTLDSCGSAFSRKEPFFSKFQKLMEVTDLVMLDLKQTDSEKHKELTGGTTPIFWIWLAICRRSASLCGSGACWCRSDR